MSDVIQILDLSSSFKTLIKIFLQNSNICTFLLWWQQQTHLFWQGYPFGLFVSNQKRQPFLPYLLLGQNELQQCQFDIKPYYELLVLSRFVTLQKTWRKSLSKRCIWKTYLTCAINSKIAIMDPSPTVANIPIWISIAKVESSLGFDLKKKVFIDVFFKVGQN